MAEHRPGRCPGFRHELLAVLCLALLPRALSSAAYAQEAPDPPPLAPSVRVLPTGGLRAETAALIVSGQQGGQLPMEVLAVPLPGPDKARLAVVVEVAGHALLAAHGGQLLQVEVFAYVLSSDNSVQGSLLRTIEVDLEQRRSTIASTGIKFYGEMDVLPGEYSLRVLVRNRETGDLGLRIQPLHVPSLIAGKPHVGAPLLADPPGDWLVVRAATTESALASIGLPDLPAAWPIAVSGKPTRLWIPLFGTAAGPATGQVQLLDREGREVVAELPLAFDDGVQTPTEGRASLVAEFLAPELPTARYLLRVALEGISEEPLVSPETSCALIGDSQAVARLWPLLTSPQPPPTADDAATRAAEAPPPPPRENIDRRPHQRAYEKALRRLATGDRRDALEAVVKLESGLVNKHGDAALEALSEVEIGTAARIADESPQALLPVCLLHHSLYLEYQQQRSFLLSSHTRTTLLEIIGLYARADDDVSRDLASQLLALLGSELQRGDVPRLAEDVLTRALSLNGENEAALLALALMCEKRGRYDAAVSHLERLVSARPSHGEGLLRLAVNQNRTGRRADARRILAVLATRNFEPWVASIAYQELAREQLDKKDLGRAEELLREGLEMLPAEQNLRFQLAMALDLDGQPAAAHQVLGQLDGNRPPKGESPRHRYARWPSDVFDAILLELQNAAEARLDDLGSVVAARSDRGDR